MTQSEALNILKTGANVFLTGEPGSGKTYTINQYIEHLRNCGVEPAVTASTGIAATHIGGMTIHSWSGVGVRNYLSEMDLDIIATNEPLTKRLTRTNILIIDEISMLSANTLDMIDVICRTVRRKPEAFGGMQVILVGDFFQLPPISRDTNTTAFAFRANVWREAKFVTCYLTEQHRQADTEFLSLLGAIRSGELDQIHFELLQSRINAKQHAKVATHLYSHNADVDKLNDRELEKIQSKAVLYTMTGKGTKSVVEGLKKGCLSPEVLILKEGATVMCTKNNSLVGYMNGTLGTVTGFVPDTKYPIIKTHDGEKIVIEPAEWVIESDGKIRGLITQIPLRLAWAITVHKSQGMSMDSARIDLSSAFEYGQGYVALSRVRSIEGLQLVGYNETALRVHPEVSSVDSMFRERSRHAVHTFGALSEPDMMKMHQRFITAVGGVWPKEGETRVRTKAKLNTKSPKGTTYEETYILLKEGNSVDTIAEKRGLKAETILSHIEKMIETKLLSKDISDKLFSESQKQELQPLIEYMKTEDSSSLSAIKTLFEDAYSYLDLRIARILSKL